MHSKTTKTLTATALAALGLSNLSPAQWVAAGAVLSAGAVATPAFASLNIPGVGIVVKKKPGNAGSIIAPADANGVVRLSGFEPGDYELSLIGELRVTTVKVERNGMLTLRAVAEDDRSNRRVEAIQPGNPLPRSMAGTDQTPEIAALRGGSVIVALRALARRPDVVIDVNRSSAGDIERLAPTTSAEAAAFIVAERAKAGAFKNPIDFAQRVCPSVSVDFAFAPTRIGTALIVARGNDPIKAGFKCAAQRAGAAPVLSIYAVSYGYVGHVTLLR